EPVKLARINVGDEDLPHAAATHGPHWVNTSVPSAELSYHANALRVRGPDREAGSLHPIHLAHTSAKHVPQTAMRTLAEEVQVHLPQGGRKPVGIFALPALTVRKVETQPVG